MIGIMILFLIFFPMIVGILNYFIGKKYNKVREYIAIFASLIEFIVIVILAFIYKKYDNSISIIGFAFEASGFRVLYSLISIFLWLMTITFSKQYMAHYDHKDRYYLFYLLTLGAVVAVFLSSDLWTTFIFFEMMSLTSFVLVIHDEKKPSMEAGLTYLAVAIISGMILLMGLFLVNGVTDTLNFKEIKEYVEVNGVSKNLYIGGVLLLFGFGAKAGMYPLHIWLPKAHPVAPAPASALLSGILTKTGVYGIIVICVNIFYETSSFGILLLALALITMFLGALLALFSIDFKRTLACSSMSQIGFILTGLAMCVLLKEENALAWEGALLHMVNHSLIKLVLFVIAGVIVMNIHKLDLNEIRGYGRKKLLINICFAIAMVGLMGIPLFNGYISKTLIHESIVELSNELSGTNYFLIKASEYIFLFSGGLTIAYMTKIYVCVFIEKNENPELQKKYDENKNYLTPLSKFVIIASTIVLPFLGFIPNLTSNNIAIMGQEFFNGEFKAIKYFSLENLKGALISLIIGSIVYFGFVRTVLIRKNKYVNIWPAWLDMEKLIYRPILFGWVKPTTKFIEILKKVITTIGKYIIIFVLIIVRAFSESTDCIIYIFRKYILRQYKYQFNANTLSYKIGNLIDKLTNNNDHKHAHRFEKFTSTFNDVDLSIASTFSFSLLMACIGVVCVLVYMITKL